MCMGAPSPWKSAEHSMLHVASVSDWVSSQHLAHQLLFPHSLMPSEPHHKGQGFQASNDFQVTYTSVYICICCCSSCSKLIVYTIPINTYMTKLSCMIDQIMHLCLASFAGLHHSSRAHSPLEHNLRC